MVSGEAYHNDVSFKLVYPIPTCLKVLKLSKTCCSLSFRTKNQVLLAPVNMSTF